MQYAIAATALLTFGLLTGQAGAADLAGSGMSDTDGALTYPDPAKWQRDRRQCEVWAARKSGASANSLHRDLWRKTTRGAAHGAIYGLFTGNPASGAWYGAGFGVLDVAVRHGRYGDAFTYCLQMKGYATD